MRRAVTILCFAAMAAASCWLTARAFPTMDGNDYRRARYFPVIDTLAIPINRTRGIYLIAPSSGTVRAPVDSLLELWRNGGATPAFRRIQHLVLFHNSVDEEEWGMTIFRGSDIVHFQQVTQAYQVLDLPIEADSIQVQGVSPKVGATQVDLGYIVW